LVAADGRSLRHQRPGRRADGRAARRGRPSRPLPDELRLPGTRPDPRLDAPLRRPRAAPLSLSESPRVISPRLVLTNAGLIDAVTEGVRPGASVTVEGDRIVEVVDGRRSPATAGAHVVDLQGAYLLPGLWDA